MDTARQRQPVSTWIKFELLERLDPLSNRLGLLTIEPGDAFVVGWLTPGLALGYVRRDLICLETCPLQGRGFYGGFALSISAVTTCTLALVKGRSIIRSPRSQRDAQKYRCQSNRKITSHA